MLDRTTSKYFIFDTFKLTGRGLGFCGYIVKGAIAVGDIMQFTSFDTEIQKTITGIDGGVRSQNPLINMVILVKCQNEAEIDKILTWRPNNEVALIFKPETLL